MVTKRKLRTNERGVKAKVSDLKLDKETVKDLTESDVKKVKGGARRDQISRLSLPCVTCGCP